ncbi:MAG TPA: hypothetical protein VKK79_14895 [Candidatus Lokiarchaeia archaeon]|nr:hypothetical protein [Candidatus Lokiarchaeia archaeon]
MGETSKAVISVTTVVSVIAGFMAIFSSGVMDPLDSIIIYEYTLPQLIWMTIIVAGPAIIVYGVWAGFRNPKDILRDTAQYLQQVGMSPGLQAQIRREVTQAANTLKQNTLAKVEGVGQEVYTKAQELGQNALNQANAKLPSGFQVHAVKVHPSLWARIRAWWNNLPPEMQSEIKQGAAKAVSSAEQAAISKIQVHSISTKKGFLGRLRMHGPALDATELEDFPLPGQVARALQGRYSVFLAESAANAPVASSTLLLTPVVARSASADGLESRSAVGKRRLHWAILLVVIAVGASLTAWLWPK